MKPLFLTLISAIFAYNYTACLAKKLEEVAIHYQRHACAIFYHEPRMDYTWPIQGMASCNHGLYSFYCVITEPGRWASNQGQGGTDYWQYDNSKFYRDTGDPSLIIIK